MSSNSKFSDKLKKFASKAASAAVSISRPNYFDPKKDSKGELSRIRKDLASELPVLKKEAIKKIIAHMTLGRDVSPLFADVIKCMQTTDIELKKLVYLYLINHAKSQPDLVILAINTFVKDTEDKNPMIKALAIRTMGCIRVTKLLDHINEPLHRCAKDKDAYVRKTVAVAISKVHDLSPDFIDECGLFEVLESLLDDKNATVVASAINSLTDMNPNAVRKLPLNKLVLLMNNCNEWNLVSLLDAVSEMQPETEEDIALISEHCIPRLQHANSAVVMSSIKILLKTLVFMDDDIAASVRRKICAALVTLVSTSQPELQWTILRNIRIIHQEHSDILTGQVRAFFCKYNEPLYVKIEKLEMLVQLYDMERFDVILGELVEYAKDVDQAFAKRAVSALGRLPLDHVVSKLRELVTSGIVLEQCIIVINNLIDQKPEMFQDLLSDIIGVTLNDPQAKISQLRLISQYASKGSEALFAAYTDNFELEPLKVRLSLIDASFLAFTKNPQCKTQFDKIIQKAEESKDSLHLCEKAAIYKKLANQKLVIKQIASAIESVDNSTSTPTILDNIDTLMVNLNSVVSVLHRHVTGAKAHIPNRHELGTMQALEKDLLDFAWDDESRAIANPIESVPFEDQLGSPEYNSPIHSAPPTINNNPVDLLTGDF